MRKSYSTDAWVKAGLYNHAEQPDIEGMQRMARSLSLPEGRVIVDEQYPQHSGLQIGLIVAGKYETYLCRTPVQVALMPQRLHQEKIGSFFNSYIGKPFAVLYFIATLFAVSAALDRYSMYRIHGWSDYLEQHNCLGTEPDQLVRDTAECGRLDAEYGRRIVWPYKVGIVIVVLIAAFIGFMVLTALGWMLVMLIPGPAAKSTQP